ncbi:hypothetical protein MHBO_003186, partial [Bonamia ostreae]
MDDSENTNQEQIKRHFYSSKELLQLFKSRTSENDFKITSECEILTDHINEPIHLYFENLNKPFEKELFVIPFRIKKHFRGQSRYERRSGRLKHYQIRKWWYVDSDGKEEGPHSSEAMKLLYKQLVFDSSVKVKNYSKMYFVELRKMVENKWSTFLGQQITLKDLNEHDKNFKKYRKFKNPKEKSVETENFNKFENLAKTQKSPEISIETEEISDISINSIDKNEKSETDEKRTVFEENIDGRQEFANKEETNKVENENLDQKTENLNENYEKLNLENKNNLDSKNTAEGYHNDQNYLLSPNFYINSEIAKIYTENQQNLRTLQNAQNQQNYQQNFQTMQNMENYQQNINDPMGYSTFYASLQQENFPNNEISKNKNNVKKDKKIKLPKNMQKWCNITVKEITGKE